MAMGVKAKEDRGKRPRGLGGTRWMFAVEGAPGGHLMEKKKEEYVSRWGRGYSNSKKRKRYKKKN